MAQQPGRSPAKYRRIAGDLRARIEAGEYPLGSQLPTKPELMASYKAALGTIDSALGLLRNLGMIESRQGTGTFVTRQHAEVEQDAGNPQVSRLRDEVRELADKVESLELNVAELYSRQGQDYPREGTARDEGPSRAVAHGSRA